MSVRARFPNTLANSASSNEHCFSHVGGFHRWGVGGEEKAWRGGGGRGTEEGRCGSGSQGSTKASESARQMALGVD